jgi:ubiquinone biosynthesis protein COQ4
MGGADIITRFARRSDYVASLISNDVLDLDKILILSISLAKSPLARPMIKLLYSDPVSQQMLIDRWRPNQVDLNYLMSLQENTLGRKYAEHLICNKIDLMLYHDEAKTDYDYVVHRLRETHDIIHTLLGCGIDIEDELQTQAFCIFNIRSPLNVILSVVLLFRLFNSEASLNRAVDSFTKGAKQGLNAKNIFAFKFEDKWDQSLDEWRRDVCIEL